MRAHPGGGERPRLGAGAGARRVEDHRVEALELGAAERGALEIAGLGAQRRRSPPDERRRRPRPASSDRHRGQHLPPGGSERQAERAAAREQFGDPPGVADRLGHGAADRVLGEAGRLQEGAGRQFDAHARKVDPDRSAGGDRLGRAACGRTPGETREVLVFSECGQASRSASPGASAVVRSTSRPLSLAVISTSPPRRAIASRASSCRSAGSRATISGRATGHWATSTRACAERTRKPSWTAARHPEGEADPAPARGRRDLGRRDRGLVQAASRERLDHGLALPGGVVGGRQMLQLAAAAGAEMPAGRWRPHAPGRGSRSAPRPDRRRAWRRGAPASARRAVPAAGTPWPPRSGRCRRPAPRVARSRARPDRRCPGASRVRLLLVFGLQPEQARTLAGARIDHGKELLAGARGAEQQPAAAIGHDLLHGAPLGRRACGAVPGPPARRPPARHHARAAGSAPAARRCRRSARPRRRSQRP